MAGERSDGASYPGKGKGPESVEIPLRPNRPQESIVDEPVDGKGIKIYSFTIDELCEENARYWFYTMKKQLELQYAWQAIETIIEGLSSAVILEMDDVKCAGEKWDYLKDRFLKSTNSMKAMKLMNMSTWTWDRQKHNQIEGYYELKRMNKEFVEMNGGKQIDIDELTIS